MKIHLFHYVRFVLILTGTIYSLIRGKEIYSLSHFRMYLDKFDDLKTYKVYKIAAVDQNNKEFVLLERNREILDSIEKNIRARKEPKKIKALFGGR